MKLHKVDVFYAKFNCPRCGKSHVDHPPWDKRLHRRHLCSGCNHQWRPDGIPPLAYSFGVDGPGWKLLAKNNHALNTLKAFVFAPFVVLALCGAWMALRGAWVTLAFVIDWVFK